MHHTRALILKKEDWREADWLVTAFTEDFGKLRLLAQGARKHGAKLQGHLEPGSLAAISFVSGRNGYRLTTARMRTSPLRGGASAFKARAIASILYALDANLWEEKDGAGTLFAEAESATDAIDSEADRERVRLITFWFHTRLFRLLGFLPPLGAPEARGVEEVIALASQPAGSLDGADVREAKIEAQLIRLVDRLGDAVKVSSAVGDRGSAIY